MTDFTKKPEVGDLFLCEHDHQTRFKHSYLLFTNLYTKKEFKRLYPVKSPEGFNVLAMIASNDLVGEYYIVNKKNFSGKKIGHIYIRMFDLYLKDGEIKYVTSLKR